MKTSMTNDLVKKIGALANLPLAEKQIEKLQEELKKSFIFIDKIQSLDTANVKESSQVTGLQNVFREDKIDEERILTQDEATSGAKSTYNGYFKVKAIFNDD